jgi:predicted RNA binding protein YcfA (HicA-like mRNA interferase family)
MSARLPNVSAKDAIRALERAGFVFQRQRGSHATLRHPVSRRTIVVPIHGGDLKRPLLKAILQQAGIGEAEFRALL